MCRSESRESLRVRDVKVLILLCYVSGVVVGI